MWFEQMHPGWQAALKSWQPWLAATQEALQYEESVVPAANLVMRVFETDPQLIRVVIVGQDPYPTPGVAIGRAFAIGQNQAALPASLKNIFAELADDLASNATCNPNLEHWQNQGVFLLNRSLTTLEGQPLAHAKLGWQSFTAAAARHLAQQDTPPIFVLWGKSAQSLEADLQPDSGIPSSVVIKAAHPSPLSAHRGFFGSKPFSAINRTLASQGKQQIDWFG